MTAYPRLCFFRPSIPTSALLPGPFIRYSACQGASAAGPCSILPDRRLSGAIPTMSGSALNPAASHAFRLTNDRNPPPFT